MQTEKRLTVKRENEKSKKSNVGKDKSLHLRPLDTLELKYVSGGRVVDVIYDRF